MSSFFLKAVLGISVLNNALALCFFIKKMTRKNNEVDVELGQEAQPAAVGLVGAAVLHMLGFFCLSG